MFLQWHWKTEDKMGREKTYREIGEREKDIQKKKERERKSEKKREKRDGRSKFDDSFACKCQLTNKSCPALRAESGVLIDSHAFGRDLSQQTEEQDSQFLISTF